MRYATGIGERGRPIDVRDPLLKSFRKNFTTRVAILRTSLKVYWASTRSSATTCLPINAFGRPPAML
jgi:hypothetical protein